LLLVWAPLLFAMVGGISAVALVTARDVLSAISVLRARPLRSLGERAQGPGIYFAELRGPSRVTPSGREAVAWLARVDVTSGSGKQRSTRELCSASELTGLSLADGGHVVVLDLVGVTVDVIRDNSLKGPSAGAISVMMRPAAERAAPPAAMLARPECKHQGGELEYYEWAAATGVSAAFSGCRSGSLLGPCLDGADLLATDCPGSGASRRCIDGRNAAEALLRHWTSGTTVLMFVMCLIGGAALAGFAVFQLVVGRRVARERLVAVRIG
jgi:hypothetical protein